MKKIEDIEIEQAALKFQQKIIDRSQLQPSVCGCKDCQKMCHTAPCLGTPFDMFAIQQIPEYQPKVAIVMNMVAPKLGLPPLLMLAPSFDKAKGHCSFYENGKCTLHEKGLKPLEGKMANCTPDAALIKATRLIMESWLPFQFQLAPVFFKKQTELITTD